jgi:GrpB-like predicted nucleotidyltransferase (UPF0157 family)
MTNKIVPHQADWQQRFLEEAEKIRAVLGNQVIAIHHIGSTAITPSKAKPIIDILPEVIDIEKIDAFAPEMAAVWYTVKGEFWIPGRRYFKKSAAGAQEFHVHVFQKGNPEIDRHVNFVEYLNAHPQEARQ